MHRKLLGFLVVLVATAAFAAPGRQQVREGSLAILGKDGQAQALCPGAVITPGAPGGSSAAAHLQDDLPLPLRHRLDRKARTFS